MPITVSQSTGGRISRMVQGSAGPARDPDRSAEARARARGEGGAAIAGNRPLLRKVTAGPAQTAD